MKGVVNIEEQGWYQVSQTAKREMAARRAELAGTGADLRLQPREAQRQIADALGLFWLPCPICGECFGGHEWAGDLDLGGGHGQGVCANCVDEANRRNAHG